MKNILIISFFLLAYKSFSQSTQIKQNVKIIYIQNQVKKEIVDDVVLLISDSLSQYVLSLKQLEKEMKDGVVISRPDLEFIAHYNMNSNLFTEQRKIKNDKYYISEWKRDNKWEITNETKIINGYKVIKATTDSQEYIKDHMSYRGKAIAWFAPDIPISSGPARYAGLPGLILEISYEKASTKYELKSIDFSSDTKISEIKAGTKVSKETILYQ